MPPASTTEQQAAGLPPTPHGRFNAEDADINIISSDTIIFRAHSKTLVSLGNNAVPDMTGGPKGEDCYWDETAGVLETFIAFIYVDGAHMI
ncbi:hypothetical protein DL96DRAFT_1719115 [Flagelloscypha sp. PMI_526]|nr:hypothetical protein DL96DRAFT_1719115 [Flagelloscypha sp. PMI_526]